MIYKGPSHALYFATYEQCKHFFETTTKSHSIIATGAAGACSTILADGFMNPFDGNSIYLILIFKYMFILYLYLTIKTVIKQRMQLSTVQQNHRSFFQVALFIARQEGWKAFYVSYPTTLAMTIPFQSIHFITYESAKRKLNPSGKYDPLTHCVSGGLAVHLIWMIKA